MDVRESFLVAVMSRGFEKAAGSFSKVVNTSIAVGQESGILKNRPEVTIHSGNDFYVLTTQIIGEVSGKSILILSQLEGQAIFKVLNSKQADKNFQEAFLLEIDNIISASVIAELANAFATEIYGDVPKLLRFSREELTSFLETEMKPDEHGNIIYCNTSFRLDSIETKPQFIWRFSSEILNLISPAKISARP